MKSRGSPIESLRHTALPFKTVVVADENSISPSCRPGTTARVPPYMHRQQFKRWRSGQYFAGAEVYPDSAAVMGTMVEGCAGRY